MKEKLKYLNWLIKEIMASFGGGIVTLALMSYLLGDGVAQFSPVIMTRFKPMLVILHRHLCRRCLLVFL